jgi:peptidyl-prolyl cis-trans isomerase D
MISWIQTTFQHHFKLVFAVLLALMIVAFVFTIGASPGIGRAERSVLARQYFDLNLNKPEDQRILFSDASLSAYLNLGYSGLNNDQLQMYALQRYAVIAIANELRIPAPSEAELKTFITGLRPFQGQNGEFDAATYNRFTANIRSNGRNSEADVARVLSSDYRVDQVNRLFSGPGYVMHSDIAQQLARSETSWTIAIANLSYESFKPTINPSEAEINKYFSDNIFRYEIQPKFDGSYVEIPLSNYLAQVKVTDAEVRAFYDANKARFSAQTEGAAKLDDAAAYSAVKTQVDLALRTERARQLAIKSASDITVSLFEKGAKPATINTLLAGYGLNTKPLPPFGSEETPAQLGGQPEIAAEAFKLSVDRIFSDALATPNGAVILIWNSTIPARKPELSEVRQKVLADYSEVERRKHFVEAGKAIKASIESRLKAGEAFAAAADAAANAFGVKAEVKTPAAFTLRQPPQDAEYTALSALERLTKGQISDMLLSGPKGLIVYVINKATPDLSPANANYALAKAQMARISGNSTGSAVVSEIVDRELKKSEPPTH